MKKNILIFLVLFLPLISFSQTFWSEDFGTGCNQGQLANAVAGPNGIWTIVSTGTNGMYANTWYISATENGNPAGSCGSGCGSDRSLHLGNVNIFGMIPPDGGASYYAGGLGGEETNRRVESPIINCTGYSNITLDCVYLENGDGNLDNATLWYYDGSSWSLLIDLPKTPFGHCAPQGLWTAYSIAMPTSANNNPNVKIAFNWTNNSDGLGSDPSFAVDDITLSVVPLPIELLSFNAIQKKDVVDLEWVTASEQNNDFFVVEKTIDGTTFFPVDTVNGSGNSNEILYYQTMDKSPFVGTSYYRLKQVDFDGAYTLSTFSAINYFPIKENKFNLYPNPTSDYFEIDIYSPTIKELNMIAYNTLGEKMYFENITLNSKRTSRTVSVMNWPFGSYQIVLIDPIKNKSIKTLQLIVQ